MANTYGLYSIAVTGTSAFVVDQITAQSLENDIENALIAGSGNLRKAFSAVMEHKPRFTFSTTQVGSALSEVGARGIQIDGTIYATVELHFRKRATGAGGYSSTTDNIKLTITEGLLIPKTLNLPQGSEATFDCELIIVGADGTAPITMVVNAAAPSAPAIADELFTLGPVTSGAVTVDDATDVTVDFGLTVEVTMGGGNVWALQAGIHEEMPVITVQSPDMANALALGGADLLGTNDSTGDGLVIYARKKDEGGGNVADGTSEHISLTGDKHNRQVTALSGSGEDSAAMTVTLTPLDNAGDFFTYAANVAIT